VGRTLFNIYKGEGTNPLAAAFKGDLSGLLVYLIDENPQGWSSINCSACSCDKPKKRQPGQDVDYEDRDLCRCSIAPLPFFNPGRTTTFMTQKNASSSGVEWVYVFDEKNKKMYVLSCSFNDDDGLRNQDAVLKPVAEIDLEGPEPDWERIQYGQALDVYNHYRTLPHHLKFAKEKDYGYAYCPNGHEFRVGWRNPGTECTGCGHIFQLPANLSAVRKISRPSRIQP
jgi:hypothetical protein